MDYQCEFAAYHLYKEKPQSVLDIGSWRLFILGLLAHFNITTIDIRNRKSILKNENVLTCDAKALKIPDESFDAVMCLASLYIFGLGRYGDPFDLDADIKAFHEMVRVLKPGGLLIFSTSIHNSEPVILFNRCRIYNYEMIRNFCNSLNCVEEKFYDRQNKRACSLEELTTDAKLFDLYMGCWRKK
jgi:ubiquinone/menaquinone biosynthesis C-methylase UbiE